MKRSLAVLIVLSSSIFAQQATETRPNGTDPKSCPLHAEHMKQQASIDDHHFAEMNERGAQAMGFDQSKTTHHFRTLPDGGAIEVTVNDPSDTADLSAIRNHLTRIAREFSEGNFAAPVMTHGEMPPGSETMRKLKAKIAYKYEELPAGARVRITTGSPEALRAVHEFVAYQIREHRTGDVQRN
jgi:TusA-related sulfurtransferase